MPASHYRVLAALNQPTLEAVPTPGHIKARLIDPLVPAPQPAKITRVALEKGGNLLVTLAETPRKGAIVQVSYEYPGGCIIIENATATPL